MIKRSIHFFDFCEIVLSRFPSLFLIREHNKHLPAERPTALGGRATQATQPAEASAGLWEKRTEVLSPGGEEQRGCSVEAESVWIWAFGLQA